DRHRAAALPRVPRRAPDVLLRRGDRAAVLPGQRRPAPRPPGRRADVLRARPPRRLGLGHVPPGPVRLQRPGRDVPRRQHRRAQGQGALMPAPPRPEPRRALGTSGEDAVARWYEREGYEILDRNWRVREGEIDLVVRRGTTVVFC